jgi:sarcosine oxidase subunit gamma
MDNALKTRASSWRALAPDLTIVEEARSITIVRTGPIADADARALGDALGVACPVTPNTQMRSGPVQIAWLGPREWAVIGMPHERVRALVVQNLPNLRVHLADASEALRAWRVGGKCAAEVLCKGCSLDLSDKAFGVEKCARSLLGQVNILLFKESGGWTLYAERALTRHLRIWFIRAGREFGLEEVHDPA